MGNNKFDHSYYMMRLRMLRAAEDHALKHLPHEMLAAAAWSNPLMAEYELNKVFKGDPNLPVAGALRDARGKIVALRHDRKAVNAEDRSQLAYRTWTTCGSLLRGVLPRHPKTGNAIGMPNIRCSENGGWSVNAATSSINLPIHWLRSVGDRGIALVTTEARVVVPVKAIARPSAFLAEQGIRYWDAVGMAINRKTGVNTRVDGYVFKHDECKPVFSKTFNAGVEAARASIVDAVLGNMSDPDPDQPVKLAP